MNQLLKSPASQILKKSDNPCAHCGERDAGAEGTVWCAGCLEWYRNTFKDAIVVTGEVQTNA